MSRLTVTSSPHIRRPDSVPKIMWSVVGALTPAMVASGYFFGWRALWVVALSVATAVACEAAAQRIRKVPVLGDIPDFVQGAYERDELIGAVMPESAAPVHILLRADPD